MVLVNWDKYRSYFKVKRKFLIRLILYKEKKKVLNLKSIRFGF